jgi:hypothetical protein
MVNIPSNSIQYGFLLDGLGSHTSRTMMLSELRLLLSACPRPTDIDGFRSSVLEENILLKQTGSTRKESFRRLREMYGLSEDLLIFRALRDLWDQETDAHSMLALLCANARDPVLRVTAETILSAHAGESVTAQMISNTVANHFPGRLNPTTLANIGRHAASTWTQSGHLAGRTNKVRVSAKCHPTSLAFALLLGYLCGERGDGLFNSFWARLLDDPLHILREQAIQASQQGWLEYRYAGNVTEISFRYLTRKGSIERN